MTIPHRILPAPWRLLLLFIGAGCLVGCEEIIDPPFELIEPRLVITSTFAPHQHVTVNLTATQPAAGEISYAHVADATVSIFEGTELLETLTYVPGDDGTRGTYVTTNFHPEVRHVYTVHAQADGFTPVSAQSSIPISVPIKSLRVENVTVSTLLETEVYDYHLVVDYEDPADQDNYYDLRIKQEVIPFRIDATTGDSIFFNPIFKSVNAPGNRNERVSSTAGYASVLLENKLAADGVSIHLQSTIRPHEELLGNIVAELRTVAEPYYRFQLDVQGTNTGGGLIEPRVNSYTNVTSGYGVFAGYNFSTSSLSLGGR